MLINTTVTIALFCASCGKAHIEEISYFSVGSGVWPVNCECGRHIGVLRAMGAGCYRLHIACELCGGEHVINLFRRAFSRGRLRRLSAACGRTEIGLAGASAAVAEEMASRSHEIDSYLKDTGIEGETKSPQVMFCIINRLDDLASKGGIVCGYCGESQLGLAVFEKHVLLYCRRCESAHWIKAADEEDARRIMKVNYIEIPGGDKRQLK